MTAAVVAFVSFLIGTVLGGRCARHLEHDTRKWVTAALGVECVVLVALSILAGTGVLSAVAFGSQNATARQFGIQELGATMSRFTVAPIIALAAILVAVSAAIFLIGPPVPVKPED